MKGLRKKQKKCFIGIVALCMLVGISYGVQANLAEGFRMSWGAAASLLRNTLQSPASATSQTLTTDGKDFLYAHDILGAKAKFLSAVNADPQDQEAQFYYGISRIFAIYEEGQSLKTSTLDSVKEILEKCGIRFITYGLYNTNSYPSSGNLPFSTPVTKEVIQFIKDKVVPEVDGAILNLSAVTNTSFSSTLQPAALNKVTAGNIVVDYADVLIIRAALYAAKAAFEMLFTYDFNFNPPQILNGEMNDLLRFRKLILSYPGFGTPKEPARLTAAKTALISFIDTFNQAIPFIKIRQASKLHLFVLDIPVEQVTNELIHATTDNTTKFQNTLADMKVSLNGPHVYSSVFTDQPESKRTFDLSKFFNPGQPINLRKLVVDNNGDFHLNDPTFGGVAPKGSNGGFRATVQLNAGWNLLALPVIPFDLSIPVVLAPIKDKIISVWGFEPDTGWKCYTFGNTDNTLTSFEAGKAYWIFANGAASLELTGVNAPTHMALKAGWNLIGYSDPLRYNRFIERAFTNTAHLKAVWRYTKSNTWQFYSPVFGAPGYQSLKHLIDSFGYWVKVDAEDIFSPPAFDPNETDGYEVWGSTSYNPASGGSVLENPPAYGFELLGKVSLSDSAYTGKVVSLNSQYSCVVIKMANPVGKTVKIDGVKDQTGNCVSPWMFRNANNFWGLFYFSWPPTTCVDGQYASLDNNGGVLFSTAGITQITVYGIR